MTRWYLRLLMVMEHLTVRMFIQKSLIACNDIIAHRDGVIDVALASRRGGAIEHDDLCGVLTDCL
jgi:hypothetical protein